MLGTEYCGASFSWSSPPSTPDPSHGRHFPSMRPRSQEGTLSPRDTLLSSPPPAVAAAVGSGTSSSFLTTLCSYSSSLSSYSGRKQEPFPTRPRARPPPQHCCSSLRLLPIRPPRRERSSFAFVLIFLVAAFPTFSARPSLLAPFIRNPSSTTPPAAPPPFLFSTGSSLLSLLLLPPTRTNSTSSSSSSTTTTNRFKAIPSTALPSSLWTSRFFLPGPVPQVEDHGGIGTSGSDASPPVVSLPSYYVSENPNKNMTNRDVSSVLVTLPDGRAVHVPIAAVIKLAQLTGPQLDHLQHIMWEHHLGDATPHHHHSLPQGPTQLGRQDDADANSKSTEKIFLSAATTAREEELFRTISSPFSSNSPPSSGMYTNGFVLDHQDLKEDIQHLITAMINNQKEFHWTIPTQQIVNATLTGGIYPTIVPGQRGPLPHPHEVYCNPAIMNCATLGDWGRAIGIPMRETFQTSMFGRFVNTTGNVLMDMEEKATAGLTSTFINFIEQEPTLATLEVLASTLSPLLTFKPSTAYWSTLRNVTEAVMWGPLDVIDKPDDIAALKQVVKAKKHAAQICRYFNGRLPNCGIGMAPSFPQVPVAPTPPVIDPATGFIIYIYVWGFQASCSIQGGCISGTPDLQPEHFDGVYTLYDVGANGQPVYIKSDMFFKDFNSVNQLFFWQKDYRFSNPLVFPNLGTWAAITPQAPDYSHAVQGSRPPFSFVLPGEATGVSPPAPCTSNIGAYKDFETTFPLCLNYSNKWRFGRANPTSCNGLRLNDLCFFPVLNQVFPVGSADPPPATDDSAQRSDGGYMGVSAWIPPGIPVPKL